jgi:hypothetical protein
VPGQRCSKIEAEERTEFVRELLAAGKYTSEIKRRFRKKYGDHDHATILRYVARAREENRKALGIDRSDATAESYNFYLSVIAHPKAAFKDRLQARLLIDKLLSLQLKLPPLEVLCAHLGCTVAELVEYFGQRVARPLPGAALPAPEASGPDQVPG